MNSKIKNILIPLIVVLVLGIQQNTAQNVTKVNGVEYINKEVANNDLNSIKVPVKKIKLRKTKLRKANKNIRTVADLEKIVQRKRNLRFRNKRRTADKCFKEEVCHTDKK
ncbi:hypothetical protein [uncultured Tenacibaculum sp.]|uniref:hypothetical protein n=1 Tax=uncultured Tenacibaculum sp. TaxID=174713 RepID=UPI00260B98DD|nr:hypothetical protein [uncultured Tenacibaculum sp.]